MKAQIFLNYNFKGNDQEVTTNNNGQASIQINNEATGTYKINIHFLGDEKYEDSHKTITLTIKTQQNNNNNNQPTPQKKNVIIKLNGIELKNKVTDINRNSINKHHTKFKVQLTSDGKKLKNKKVSVQMGKGKKISVKTGKYGQKIKLGKVTVRFKGDDNYNINKKTAYIYKRINIEELRPSAKLNDVLNLEIDELKNVDEYKLKFKISNKKYKIKFKNGKAKFKVGKKYNMKEGGTYELKFSRGKYWPKDHTIKIKKKK